MTRTIGSPSGATKKKKKRETPLKEQSVIKSFAPDKQTGERSRFHATGGANSQVTVLNPNEETFKFGQERAEKIFAENQAEREALGANADFIKSAQRGLIKPRQAVRAIQQRDAPPPTPRELTNREKSTAALAGFKEKREKGGFIDREALGKTFGAENLSNATFNILGGLPIPDVIGPATKLAAGTKLAGRGAQAGGKGVQEGVKAAAETTNRPTQFLSGRAGDLSKQAGEGFKTVTEEEVKRNLTSQFRGTKFSKKSLRDFTANVNEQASLQKQSFESQIRQGSIEIRQALIKEGTPIGEVTPTQIGATTTRVGGLFNKDKFLSEKLPIGNVTKKYGLSTEQAGAIEKRLGFMRVDEISNQVREGSKSWLVRNKKAAGITAAGAVGITGGQAAWIYFGADTAITSHDFWTKEVMAMVTFGDMSIDEAMGHIDNSITKISGTNRAVKILLLNPGVHVLGAGVAAGHGEEVMRRLEIRKEQLLRL